ncbi:MAG: hypothetical protein MJ252_21430 [archaeon]|nr:hypothetical protein [archaeon]
MLFVVNFIEDLILPPSLLGKNIRAVIRAKLLDKVQGTISEKYGYILCIVNVGDISNGRILNTTGDLEFTVSFRAIVYKPLLNEVCEGVVDEIKPQGMQISVGPMDVFVGATDIPKSFTYNEKNNCFMSNGNVIGQNSNVRIRLVVTQFLDGKFKPVGTMKGDYLGPI